MNAIKPPSFVGINEAKGTFTIAYLASWYDEARCDDCPRFHRVDVSSTKILFCDLIEEEEPCEVTGIRYKGEK